MSGMAACTAGNAGKTGGAPVHAEALTVWRQEDPGPQPFEKPMENIIYIYIPPVFLNTPCALTHGPVSRSQPEAEACQVPGMVWRRTTASLQLQRCAHIALNPLLHAPRARSMAMAQCHNHMTDCSVFN